MKVYKIFKDSIGQYEAVKQGWSWPAFFFVGIWACVKKMWGLGIILIILSIILSFFNFGAEKLVSMDPAFAIFLPFLFLIGITIRILMGAYGNKLREKYLISRGYQYQKKDTEFIIAQNPQMAIIQYISKYEK